MQNMKRLITAQNIGLVVALAVAIYGALVDIDGMYALAGTVTVLSIWTLEG